MMGPSRKPVGSIHRIREFELEKVTLSDEFDILQIVGEGWFGKILLVEHRATDTEMVLKALPKPYVSLRDFYREFHYGLHLGVHRNIVTTYDVAFETAGFYVFTQEYAPLGDLTSNVLETGIGELHTKRVAKQIASALDFMHSKEIVHRDVKLDNVLVCRSDFSRVKLCDFGESRKDGSMVQRRNEWLPYSPPEVLLINTEDSYKALPSHDVWQFGIVIFVCLTGCLPWQKAAPDDPRYNRYTTWHGTSIVMPIRRTPKLFKLISSKACKMFRKFLEPNKDRRPSNVGDLQKFIDDRWLAKGAEKNIVASEPDELCASMYSFHSSVEEKNKLLSTLAQHGIETTVNRVEKKQRIREWIQSSVIAEEDEEDNSGTTTPSSTNSRTPIAGHISSVRAKEELDKKIISTTKDATNKHIDPRTGLIQQGPSEMGTQGSAANNNDPHRSMSPSPPVETNREMSPTINGNQPPKSQTTNINETDRPSPLSRNRQTAVTTNGRIQRSADSSSTNPPNGLLRQQMNSSSIVDSGYGSLDKLRTPSTDFNRIATGLAGRGHIGGAPYLSPVLSRRSKPAFNPSQAQHSSREYTTRKSTGVLLRNQELVETKESEREEDAEGIVHLATSSNRQRDRSSSRKDTAYDRFVSIK